MMMNNGQGMNMNNMMQNNMNNTNSMNSMNNMNNMNMMKGMISNMGNNMNMNNNMMGNMQNMGMKRLNMNSKYLTKIPITSHTKPIFGHTNRMRYFLRMGTM